MDVSLSSNDPNATDTAAAIMNADHVSVHRWLAFYVVFLAVCVTGLALQIGNMHTDFSPWHNGVAAWKSQWSHSLGAWKELWNGFLSVFASSPAQFRLLFLLTFLTMCTTLTPMPTGPLVAAMATQELAVGGGLWSTTLLVAVVGAAGSTIANLNDYCIFTLVLRSKKIAKIRNTRVYHVASRWFDRAPFFILTLFNLMPITVDVARLLAITCRYDRSKFAASSFVGRFFRYGVFAFVTYYFHLGWIAPLALLALTIVLAGIKGLTTLLGGKTAASR